ncbi:2-dehydro-3-deoxygalactonokinase [Daejeonella sp.]|uniref:2-dehydro-3-deoxygalactonokinase n=1 Tax=Daejeonella sp. TaxID=2805397 RepID=UPI0030BF7BCC
MNKTLLCCDWGTSTFRLRLVGTSDYKVIAEQQSAEGVAITFSSWQAEGSSNRFDFYAFKLKSAIDQLARSSALDLSNIPVIVSGMASSSIGMEEIPYAPVPFALDGSGVSCRIFENYNGAGSSLTLVSGIRTHNDVMRGEEAQLIGLFNLAETSAIDKEDALFVFPGTHSKHMRVERKSIVGFQTFMTGEIYNILSEHSILKDSIGTGGDFENPGNQGAFINGVESSESSNLLNTLFAVRTNQLFSKFRKEQNAFFLSGLLIGTELRQLADESYRQLVICSGKHLYGHYRLAAEALCLTENITFIQPELIEKATIAGQVQIFKALNNFYE